LIDESQGAIVEKLGELKAKIMSGTFNGMEVPFSLARDVFPRSADHRGMPRGRPHTLSKQWS
jgi:hypothetical protein